MGTSASFARRMAASLFAFLLASSLAPFGWAPSAWADEGSSQPADGPEEAQAQAVGSDVDRASSSEGSDAEAAPSGTNPPQASTSSPNDGPSLVAGALVGQPASFVNADVALGGEPVVGSFTVDGLTYAVAGDASVELVCVSDDAAVSDPGDSQQVLDLPASVSYGSTTYALASIAPYAFHLSSVESVTLPATVTDVEERAFRASSVGSVEVAEGNPDYSSYDGALYSADRSRLLLIPEGRKGSARIASEAEEVPASAFSHCAGVEALSVDAGGAAFSSADDCLYDASGETLIRVPAGATDITVKDGCTVIAAGAMEGCTKLESITTPASVSSISPYVFSQEPETVNLPAATMVDGDSAEGVQISSTVALTASDDSLPEVDPSSIRVVLPEGAVEGPWLSLPFSLSASLKSEDPFLSSCGEAALAASPQEVMPYGASTIELGLGEFEGYYVLEGLWMPPGWDPPTLQVGQKIASLSGRTGEQAARLTLQDDGVAEWRNTNGNQGFVGAYEVLRAHHSAGLRFKGWALDPSATAAYSETMPFTYTLWQTSPNRNVMFYPIWHEERSVSFDPNGGSWEGDASPKAVTQRILDEEVEVPSPPQREGYSFLGWCDESGSLVFGPSSATAPNMAVDAPLDVTLYAKWSYSLSFDTSSEPGDGDYPGDAKDDLPMTSDDGQVQIEPPTRPGYVFQGWVVDGKPNDTGLLTEGEDGTWSVDASKLPEYVDGNGKVSLTARWTAAISVDAPISATFMYDLTQWDGSESRDAMTVEGSSTVRNRSAVPIRVSGLESETGSAANVLKKDDGTTLADASKGDEAKVLSVFPTTSDSTGTESDAKGGATDDAGDDLAHKVDLALSEIKLEADFDADAWAIPAGASANGAVTAPGEAKLGYRLNLGSSTGVTLDKDALLAATGDPTAGASSKAASIADLTYCFAADWDSPADWGEPLWIENPDRTSNPAKHLLLADIKEAAEDLSAKGTGSEHYALYKGLLDAQVTSSGNPGPGPYFQLLVDGRYLPLQLIGICQDTKSDGTGKAGLTFQMRDIYAYDNARSSAAGGGAFASSINAAGSSTGDWGRSALRERLSGRKADGSASTILPAFWGYLPAQTQAAIVPVDKRQQLYGGTSAGYLQATEESVWLPSVHEVFGFASTDYNESEGLDGSRFQYQAYQGNGASTTNAKAIKTYDGAVRNWWMRSALRSYSDRFCSVYSDGQRGHNTEESGLGVAPAFCL